MPDPDHKVPAQSKASPLLGLDKHAIDHIYFVLIFLVAIGIALIYGVFNWVIRAFH